jgi:hypothetical protein
VCAYSAAADCIIHSAMAKHFHTHARPYCVRRKPPCAHSDVNAHRLNCSVVRARADNDCGRPNLRAHSDPPLVCVCGV